MTAFACIFVPDFPSRPCRTEPSLRSQALAVLKAGAAANDFA
jgi:hypothetical protein